jgi:hypothetical protein
MISDEELGRIARDVYLSRGTTFTDVVRAVREAVTADWEGDRDASAIRLDATQHALEISEAQREELREKLAAADREVAEHRKHISIIMSRESEAQGELLKAKRTLRRAVVEVPEGVPSALELTHEWLRGGAYGVPPIQFALDRLAPFLQPSASVPDSIPAETLEQLAAMRARLDQAEATLSKMRQIVPDVGECDDWCERCGKYVVGVFPGGHVGGVCPICDRSTNTYLDPIRDILYTKDQAMGRWKLSGPREIEVEPGVFFADTELGSLCHLRNTGMARLTAERDEYKRRLGEVLALVNDMRCRVDTTCECPRCYTARRAKAIAEGEA